MTAGTQTSAACVLERLAEKVYSPSCPEKVLELAFLLCPCSVGVLTWWAERRRSPNKRDVLGWELGPFSGQWSGSVGFSFTLFPRVAELQGEDVGSFYLNIFLTLDKCPASVTSPRTQEGTHSFNSYFPRPYRLPGTEYSKMAEMIPALKSLPVRSKSCRIRTLS